MIRPTPNMIAEKVGPVGKLVFNKPAKRNALAASLTSPNIIWVLRVAPAGCAPGPIQLAPWLVVRAKASPPVERSSHAA